MDVPIPAGKVSLSPRIAIAIIVAKKGCELTIDLLTDTPTLSNPRYLKYLPNALPNRPLKMKNKTAVLSKYMGEKEDTANTQNITELTDKLIISPDRMSKYFKPFFAKIEDNPNRIAAKSARAETIIMTHHHEICLSIIY